MANPLIARGWRSPIPSVVFYANGPLALGTAGASWHFTLVVGSWLRRGAANFARIHQTLRVTPAMAAGVTDRVWEIGEIVDLLG